MKAKPSIAYLQALRARPGRMPERVKYERWDKYEARLDRWEANRRKRLMKRDKAMKPSEWRALVAARCLEWA